MKDFFTSCRACKYFKAGKCLNDRIFNNTGFLNVIQCSEDGVLSEVIREATSKKIFKQLEANLDGVLSKKKAKQIKEDFYIELEKFLDEWVEQIDEAIYTLAVNSKTQIEHDVLFPEDFSCEFFD